MKTSRLLIVLVSLAAVLGGLGCAALSNYITPAVIDGRAVDYATAIGVAEPNEFAGYGNLRKAVKLEKSVGAAHEQTQLNLLQLAEKDNLVYAQLNDIVKNNRINSQISEEQLFGKTGLLSMVLGLLGAGTLTGYLGLMRKRPGDITPEEVKQVVSGKEAELTAKEIQIIELVKGVQEFIDFSEDPVPVTILMDSLAKAQSIGTKQTVAKIKATL